MGKHTCPKCGSKNIIIRWHRDRFDCTRYYNESKHEHLHFKCQTCGYDWVEPTIDSRDEAMRKAWKTIIKASK